MKSANKKEISMDAHDNTPPPPPPKYLCDQVTILEM